MVRAAQGAGGQGGAGGKKPGRWMEWIKNAFPSLSLYGRCFSGGTWTRWGRWEVPALVVELFDVFEVIWRQRGGDIILDLFIVASLDGEEW